MIMHYCIFCGDVCAPQDEWLTRGKSKRKLYFHYLCYERKLREYKETKLCKNTKPGR